MSSRSPVSVAGFTAALTLSVIAAVWITSHDTAIGGTDAGASPTGPTIASVTPLPATTMGTATTVPASVASLDHALSKGNAGSDVSRLQDRLRELAFYPGPSDGVFGPSTEQAVWAFEKLVLGTAANAVTGRVTSETGRR